MSNRCPHCGAAGGKSHEPCPYAPGGKKYKAPAVKGPAPRADEIKAVAAAALAHGKPSPPPTAEEIAAIPHAPISLTLEREVAMPKRRAAKASELQAKVEGVKAKTPRPLSRAGKKAATIWLTPDEMKRLQRAALDHEVPQERILAEGLAVMLDGKYKI